MNIRIVLTLLSLVMPLAVSSEAQVDASRPTSPWLWPGLRQ